MEVSISSPAQAGRKCQCVLGGRGGSLTSLGGVSAGAGMCVIFGEGRDAASGVVVAGGWFGGGADTEAQ